jgi:alpha-L-arabinofuranosidase
MPQAQLTVDPSLRRRESESPAFGSFVEHLGRCVCDGIYEPSHPLSDNDGFRTDVLELVRELGVSTIRYPGGNFVSGFRWEDAIGPRKDRPTRLDLAWHSTESNEVGIDEFAGWLEKTGSELIYALNLGSRGGQEVLDGLEYANVLSGTELSDLRNGTAECGPTPQRDTEPGLHADLRVLGAHGPLAHLRGRRLYLLPRLLSGVRRGRRQFLGVRREHGNAHLER